MPSLIQVIRAAIVGAGVSPVYMIDAPDEAPVVLVIPYNSDSDSDLPLGRQSFHVRVRTDAYPEGESMAWTVFMAVMEADWSTADRKVHSVVPRQEPFFLGIDDGGKYVHEFNFDVIANWKE